MAHPDTTAEPLQTLPEAPQWVLDVLRFVLEGHPQVCFLNDHAQLARLQGGEPFFAAYGVFAWTRLPRHNPALHVLYTFDGQLDLFWSVPRTLSQLNRDRFKRDAMRFSREMLRGGAGRVLRSMRMLDVAEARAVVSETLDLESATSEHSRSTH